MSAMRRVAPCLILLLAPTLAWAASGSYADPDRGPCVDAPHSAARGAAPDTDSAPPAHANGTRSRSSTTQGGGNDGDLVVPRMRMPRWHSFLPGMFR
ncbi:hypothetical protein [[Pseudomonas] boreopolis]|uniref:hypothetical protein n=1 Tax=Xanthomonas boreopolis TaxID=86183 RepID=UPI003D9AF0A3